VIFILLALIGLVLTSVQVLLVVRFRRSSRLELRPQVTQPERPLISILKPVCGLDDELEENLVSFTSLRGIRYEVVVSAEEWSDPALEVVRRVMRAHPEAPFRVVVDGGSPFGVVNRKVERLIAAAREASGEIFFISDSNARVEPDDLARTLEAFEHPRVGCVSNVFTGAGARSFGATIESLHLLSFVAAGAVLASAANVPCVVGKSMAITRAAHDAIGGFARFRRVLAEDQAIGLAMKEAGFEVVLSPVVVRNVVVRRSVRRAVDRQIRWNKIRYSFSHLLYTAELLLNPLVFACVSGEPLVVAAVLLARSAQLVALNQSLEARLTWRQLAAFPLLDLLMVYAWCVPFFSNSVTWRGYRARIGRNTEMIERAA
jgi:ceramide glucosyltransferase